MQSKYKAYIVPFSFKEFLLTVLLLSKQIDTTMIPIMYGFSILLIIKRLKITKVGQPFAFIFNVVWVRPFITT